MIMLGDDKVLGQQFKYILDNRKIVINISRESKEIMRGVEQ